ncbi:MAG: hypothetical protein K2L11_09990 [Muribaculaceae bacterium]|nr:hypothetical protein [Muribaculaceae bacterium]
MKFFTMTPERLKTLLAAVALTAAAVDVFPFAWQPTIQNPNPAFDVTSSFAVENLTFLCNGVEGPALTEVLPVWIDEDGNEIAARSGIKDPNGWNPEEFTYLFSMADFKSNGEYTLLFPEGLLVNSAGERSDKLEWQFSFDVNELAPPMFEDFKVVSVSPDFSEPQGVWNDQRVSVSTNHNESIGLTTLQLFDVTAGESLALSSNFASGRGLGYGSPVAWNVAGNYKFYEGHEYRADFVFYNGRDQYGSMGEPTAVVDRASFSFVGKVEPYAYSPVSLVEVTPVPGVSLISSPADAVFTYTFSGPVSLYKAETPLGSAGVKVYPQSCISSNEDKTVWTLDLSKDSFIASQNSTVIINVYVRDADGSQVQGNEGSEENSCFQYEWECELGAVQLSVVTPLAGSTLDKLSRVTVKSVDGSSLSWSWMGTATVSSEADGQLGRLYMDSSNAMSSSEVSFTQWIPAGASSPQLLDISEEGAYTVYFSHGCFFTGSDSDSGQSRSVSSSFRISTGGEVPPSFDDFKVLSVYPDLQQTQGEWSGQTVTLNTNCNDAIGLVTLVVTDQTSGQYVLRSNNSSTGRAPGNSSEISWSVPGSYKFLQGHRYNAEFIFYNGSGELGGQPGDAPEVGRVSYQFSGSVPEYTYSPFSLESVEPTPGLFTVSSPDKAVFKYSFSGPVEIYKAVSQKADWSIEEYPTSCLSSNADKTVWTLDLSGNEYVRNLDGALLISVYARDFDGLQLKGNYGDKENSCFRYEWDCILGSRAVAVASPAMDSEVETLTEITVRSVDGLPLSWAWGSGAVLDEDGKEIGQLGYVESSDAEQADAVRFSWWIPSGESALQPLCLETKGKYSVSFGQGAFLVGNESDQKRSLAVSSSFSVSGRTYSLYSLVGVTPEPEVVISDPAQALFVYSFSGPVDVYKVVTPLEDGQTLEYPASCLSSNEDRTVWTLDLSESEYVLDLDGTLVISIYARDLDGYPLQGNYGSEVDSCFRYEWECTVGAVPEIRDTLVYESVEPQPGSVVTSISDIRVIYSETAVPVVSSVDVYVEGEDEPVAKALLESDSEDIKVVAVLLEEPVAKAGVYSIVFPQGVIVDETFAVTEGKRGFYNPDFTLVYTVEPEDDAVDAMTVAVGHDVYDMHGRIVVHDADSSDLERLQKGIYVSNGKKIVIK